MPDFLPQSFETSLARRGLPHHPASIHYHPLSDSPPPHLDKDVVQDPPPLRHGSNILLVRVDLVPRKLAAARVEVDLGELEPAAALPEESSNPKEDDDWQGKVGVEKGLGRGHVRANWGDRNVEL